VLAGSGGEAREVGDDGQGLSAEQKLSLHAFYQARKRLRALGFLPPGRPRTVRPKAKAPAFSKLELLSPRRSGADFRLGLPNGLTFEWSGSELPSPVVDLLERLIQLR